MFFSEEQINRVSFLRENTDFIIEAALFPHSQLIFIKNGFPLVDNAENLNLLRYPVGTNPKLHKILQKWALLNKEKAYELRAYPSIVFLGLMDEGKDKALIHKAYSGTPYFVIDLTNRETQYTLHFTEKQPLEPVSVEELVDAPYTLLSNRNQIFQMANSEASLFGYANMFVDWLGKQNFCPQCGEPVIKTQAGTKLMCTSKLLKEASDGQRAKYACESKNMSVSNIQFPRTDPVCIVAIVNMEKRKLLLGNGLRFPTPKFFSCIAGFMEPGESIETCCARECWEETGVRCTSVRMVNSQPWPFPVNLMIGCIGYVEFNGKDEVIDLGHDPELRAAKWFDFDEIKELLENGGTSDDVVLPPKTAIARTLIEGVVGGGFTKL